MNKFTSRFGSNGRTNQLITFFVALLICTSLISEAIAQQPEIKGPQPPSPPELLKIETAGGSLTFLVEVARTPIQQMTGMMFRRHLAENRGMIFISKQPRVYSMWMKNTLIPLDMVFIASGGRVSSIAKNATPQSTEIISSTEPVIAVLELAGGVTDKLGIKTNDRVIFSTFNHSY